MKTEHEFPPIDFDCQIAATMLAHRLEEAGLRILRSFDLSTAACVPRPDVPCPHHATVPCTCQLVVLLVYGKEGPPLSLIAHGYDNQTWFSVVEDPARPADGVIGNIVRRAFDALRPGTSTPGAAVYAART